eukprot:3581508-Rhodomonas_salina.1
MQFHRNTVISDPLPRQADKFPVVLLKTRKDILSNPLPRQAGLLSDALLTTHKDVHRTRDHCTDSAEPSGELSGQSLLVLLCVVDLRQRLLNSRYF